MAFNNIVVHGSHFCNDKIKFTGRNTQRNIVWKCSANTYKEIYEWLVDHEVITLWDENPVDKFLLEELKKTYSDYEDEDGELDLEKLYMDGNYILSNDESYRQIISNERGNAFYQEWE